MPGVYLRKPMSFAKARLLAPFSARQRARLSLTGLHPDLPMVADHCVLSPTPRYLYVKNAKAACSSVTMAIHVWQTGWAPEKRIHASTAIPQGWRAYDRVSRELEDPAVTRFIFVREPLSRLVSGFLYYLVDRKARLLYRHEPFLKAWGWDPAMPVERSFDLFLDYLEAGMAADVRRVDIHFRPQFYNLRPDLIRYGFVRRVETLARDLATLEEMFDIPSERRTPEVPRRNPARSSFKPSEAQAARARELLRMDYEAFGY